MATFPGKPPNPLGFKCELNLAGSWTDITNYVMLRNQVQITGMGRADESSTISASQVTLTLKNDGRFTPKNSAGAYYPNIIRNCQIRISVNATSGTAVAYSGYRFFGEISSWPPATDISGRDTYVSVTASGIWRRVTASTATLGSPYSRYLNQLTGTSVPASAWAMEDGNGSTAFVTEVGAGAAATITGTPSFAADSTSFTGCDALPQFNGARITANVTSAATPTDNVIRFALSVPAAGDSTGATFASGGIANILTSGTIAHIGVSLAANQLVIQGWLSGGASAFGPSTITTKVNGVPVLVSVELTPSGSSVNWALKVIKPGAGSVLDSVSGTRASSSIAAVTQVMLDNQGRFTDTACGELAVFYAVPSITTAAAALSGFAGEFAVDRFNRICAEQGIATTVIGSTSAAMGPQADDTLSNVLQSVEDTDGGLLFEPPGLFGLGYRTLISLQNQSVAVTLSATGRQIDPPAPTYDDQLVKNQWLVTNTDGYVAQATLTSGAVSIAAVPNGVGLYAGTASTNASTHAQVNAIAQQRLFTGTVDDVRYPTVAVNMARSGVAPLFATVPGLRVGDYIQITNLPATIGGSATSKQLAWGYAESIGGNPEGWSITYNCVPEAPFETGYSPGVYSVVQAPSGTVAQGASVGSSVSASQLPPGSVGVSGTISARSIGGVTQYIASTTPYDWTFAVSGTPTDATYFICTEDQALPIYAGDTFTNSGGLGGPFTVTALAPPSGGNVSVYYTPDASSVMSSGTVYGGKNGDSWVNTAAGNQLEQWQAGAWVPIQFGPAALSFTAGGAKVTFSANASPPGSPATGDLWYVTDQGNQLKQWNGSSWVLYQFGTSAIAAGTVTAALIAANTITAAQIAAGTITATQMAAGTITASQIAANTITAGEIAAGIVIAGIVDATTIVGANLVLYGSSGEVLIYSGTPAAGNLIHSVSPVAFTDGFGNYVFAGSTSYANPSSGYYIATVSGAGVTTTYASTTYTGSYGTLGQAGSLTNDGQMHYSAHSGTHLICDTNWYHQDPVAASGEEVWHDMRPLSGSFVGTISGSYPPQYRMAPDGSVEVFGYIQAPGTGNPNSITFFTMPSAYQPQYNFMDWPITCNQEPSASAAFTPRCEVTNSGTLQIHQAPTSYSSTPVFCISGKYPMDLQGLIAT